MFHAVSFPPPLCFFRAYRRRLDMISNEGKQNFQLHTFTNFTDADEPPKKRRRQLEVIDEVEAGMRIEIQCLWELALIY
jgi:hypothetical protein